MALRAAENLPEDRPLACSFCGAEEAEVRKLIAGDVETICERCVLAAIGRLVHHATDAHPEGDAVLAGELACSFCHQTGSATAVNALVSARRARVCDRCLANILTAIAADLWSREKAAILIDLDQA